VRFGRGGEGRGGDERGWDGIYNHTEMRKA
jgi:hypothetical protein